MNPFAPFKPPFVYDPAESEVIDTNGRLFLDIEMSTKQAERDRLGQLIAHLMNQHAEERERDGN